MSNFICSECGMNNIDCGRYGYKTPREIELEKKLHIAIAALTEYSDEKNYENKECFKVYEIGNDYPSFIDNTLAIESLKQIKEVK